MTGAADLDALLTGLDPQLHEGVYVFATLPPGIRLDVEPVAAIQEAEGRTVVVRAADAERLGLAGEYPCARITLRVRSALAAVGLIARVAGALAAQGISVNPVAGLHHDHLFVPHDAAAAAMAVLAGLARAAGSRTTVGGYELDEDPARVDRDVVWRFLSTEAYWSRNRTRADVETQLDRAFRLVGAYRRGTGEMVGFARGVSDGVTFGYLADVFVLAEARGAGLGKAIVARIIDDPRIRWVLFTQDAHGLYESLGFAGPDRTCLIRPARP
jgi:hypothetical protein